MLEPLAEEESVALLASLPGGDELTADARLRIVEVTAGNPLFAEQLFAFVAERGPAVLDDVPPSVEALLERRLDLLDSDERALLQRAAVIGREFAHRALVELSPAEAAATALGPPVRARPQGPHPPRPRSGRGGVPLPPRARARRRLQRPAEGRPRAPARALRRLAGRRAGRAGRDRRLPPRAGVPLPRRAGPARPPRKAARSRRGPAARRCRHALVEERRRAGDDQSARPRDLAAPENDAWRRSCSASSASRSTRPETPRAPRRR